MRPVNKAPYVPQATISNPSLFGVKQYGSLMDTEWDEEKLKKGRAKFRKQNVEMEVWPTTGLKRRKL